MKKTIVTLGLYAGILSGTFAQNKISPEKAEQKYELNSKPAPVTGFRSLKLDEVNLVSSYYEQDGNNSAVTGGIGTEYLFDIANSLDLKLSFTDKKARKHSINADFSIDYYSSASSDMIDPRSLSSASMVDVHIYPSLSWSMKNDKKRQTFGANLSYSTEWDYQSYGANLSFAQASKDNNTEVALKIGAFFDTWEVILPVELRPNIDQKYKPRNSFNASLSVSQVVNKRLQLMAVIEPAYQEGLLSTPYHRVYFTDGTLKLEKLPGTRLKLPVGLRASYFLGDRFVFRSFYRYYQDDWGMKAHTLSMEIPVKITSFLSVTPHYRFNSQSAVKYFQPFKTHQLSEAFYSSDYDISGFNSAFWGAGIRIAPPDGVLGIKHWSSAELRYGHYNRTNGMVANIITLSAKFK